MTRRERPLCRSAIDKYGLHFDRSGARDAAHVVNRDGRHVGVSQGVLAQLRKQVEEEGS